MRQDSAYLRANYTSMGFSVLEEYLMTSGRYDFYDTESDGWHFSGTKKQMEVVVLFNMICNNWLKSSFNKNH